MMLLAATSKVPFYIAGAVLVAWAFAVSAVGISSPSFPTDAAGQRLVVLVSLVLAAVAIAMAIGTS
jgi:NADH:ubiquinone oxidoreductase subunit 6 (subunit J)